MTAPSVLIQDGLALYDKTVQVKDMVEGLAAGEFHDIQSRLSAHHAYAAIEDFEAEVVRRLAELDYERRRVT